jgi:hypothetical protein
MKVKMFISLFAIGLLAFNFSQRRSGEGKKGVALQNITVMQANAGEMYCDLTLSMTCTDASGNVIPNHTGYLVYMW